MITGIVAYLGCLLGDPFGVSVHLALLASGISLGLALFASPPPVPRIVLLVLALALGAGTSFAIAPVVCRDWIPLGVGLVLAGPPAVWGARQWSAGKPRTAIVGVLITNVFNTGIAIGIGTLLGIV